MMLAHELLDAMNPESADYGRVLQSVKFDLGDYDSLFRMSDLSTKTFWRPPFPVCLFQASEGQDCHLFLTTVEDGVLMHVTCFYKNQGTNFKWEHAGIHCRVWFDGKSIGFYTHDGKDITQDVLNSEDSLLFARNLTDLAKSLEVFSCSNVVQIEHAGPKFINQRRARKNKPPIFSYRTLHITGEAETKHCGTADRTPPRLHLRRGHIRRIGDRRIWVRSAIVGSKEAGFVAKNYTVGLRKTVGASQDAPSDTTGQKQ